MFDKWHLWQFWENQTPSKWSIPDFVDIFGADQIQAWQIISLPKWGSFFAKSTCLTNKTKIGNCSTQLILYTVGVDPPVWHCGLSHEAGISSRAWGTKPYNDTSLLIVYLVRKKMLKIYDGFKLMMISQTLYLKSKKFNSPGRWRFPKPGRDGDPKRHLGRDLTTGDLNNALNKDYKCESILGEPWKWKWQFCKLCKLFLRLSKLGWRPKTSSFLNIANCQVKSIGMEAFEKVWSINSDMSVYLRPDCELEPGDVERWVRCCLIGMLFIVY